MSSGKRRWGKAAWAAWFAFLVAACLRFSGGIARDFQDVKAAAGALEREDRAFKEALQARRDQADIRLMVEQEAALRANLAAGRYLANDDEPAR